MDTTDMDESTEVELDDVTDEADPGLIFLGMMQQIPHLIKV